MRPHDRMKTYRARLRESGLRPIQIWVQDTRKEGFAEECKKQSLVLLNDPQEKEILEFFIAANDTEGWK